jgi:DNA repair protein RadC
MDTLFQSQAPYQLPKLKLLPLREQPAYRVAQDPEACNLAELLAAIVGGAQQIETAEALLAKFGSISRLPGSPGEIASVKGIGQQTAVRLKAALALARKAPERAEGPDHRQPGGSGSRRNVRNVPAGTG